MRGAAYTSTVVPVVCYMIDKLCIIQIQICVISILVLNIIDILTVLLADLACKFALILHDTRSIQCHSYELTQQLIID